MDFSKIVSSYNWESAAIKLEEDDDMLYKTNEVGNDQEKLEEVKNNLGDHARRTLELNEEEIIVKIEEEDDPLNGIPRSLTSSKGSCLFSRIVIFFKHFIALQYF